jgi:hypothetical protein
MLWVCVCYNYVLNGTLKIRIKMRTLTHDIVQNEYFTIESIRYNVISGENK